MSKSQRDAQRDKVAWNHVEFPHLILDLWVYISHAPARLRIAANMCGFACGYAAVCLQRPLWFAYGATQAGCGVELAVRLLQRTSTHAPTSSSIEALLLLSGANY